MAKGVPAGGVFVRSDEVGDGFGSQVPQQVRFGQPGGPPKQGQREPPSQHGGHREQVAGRRAERVDPPGQAPDQAGRHLAGHRVAHLPTLWAGREHGTVEHAGEQLIDEEGIARAARPEQVDHAAGQRGGLDVQAGGRQPAQRVAVQPPQLDEQTLELALMDEESTCPPPICRTTNGLPV
jgi:hypothetical protein